jgi:flavorubredoxin
MGVTNQQSGTRIDEIADGIFRIATPVREAPGGFSFNQYLIRDEQPLLHHSGPRGMFPLVREAMATVIKPESLRWVSFSHFENDECGAIQEWLSLAPGCAPLCGKINALINGDFFPRPPHALDDGAKISLGRHTVRWLDTPHLPHAWECGHIFEESTRTLLCGDLFTQGGAEHPPITSSEILGPSEAFRRQLDYFSQTRDVKKLMEKVASTNPTTLACMHGAAWQGDGAKLLRALAGSLAEG